MDLTQKALCTTNHSYLYFTRFNKRPEDFPTLRAYNDYLEEVEDITFNLMNEVDVAETEARITAYELENKEAIAANEARLVSNFRKKGMALSI